MNAVVKWQNLIYFPLNIHTAAPTVNTVDGDYNYERRDGVMEWILPAIDESNAEGSIEFSVKDASSSNQFFPVTVSFRSKKTFAGIEILGVEQKEVE